MSFSVEKRLGKGSYGTVNSVTDEGGNIYALKSYSDVLDNVNELDVLRRMRHVNIVPMRSWYFNNPTNDENLDYDKLFVLMPMADMDLKQYVRSRKLSKDEMCSAMYQISCGLKFLCDHGVLHLDMKPDNVLVFGGGVMKISDFGMVCYTNDSTIPACTQLYEVFTIDYRPPEEIKLAPWEHHDYQRRQVDEKSIVWSLGMIFTFIASRGKALTSDVDYSMEPEYLIPALLKIINYRLCTNRGYTLEKIGKVDTDLADLVDRMLVLDKDSRITLAEVLNHPYFTKAGLDTPPPGSAITTQRPTLGYELVSLGDEWEQDLRSLIMLMLAMCGYHQNHLSAEAFFLAVSLFRRSVMNQDIIDDIEFAVTMAISSVVIASNLLSTPVSSMGIYNSYRTKYILDTELYSISPTILSFNIDANAIIAGTNTIISNIDCCLYVTNIFTVAWSLESLVSLFPLCYVPDYVTVDFNEAAVHVSNVDTTGDISHVQSKYCYASQLESRLRSDKTRR